jgi:hypothetical protein
VREIILLLKPIQFPRLELQRTKPIQFFINSLTEWSEIYTLSSALKFPLRSIVWATVNIKLLLGELVEVSFCKIVYDMLVSIKIRTIMYLEPSGLLRGGGYLLCLLLLLNVILLNLLCLCNCHNFYLFV